LRFAVCSFISYEITHTTTGSTNMKEREHTHIYKGSEENLQQGTKTFCKIFLSDAKKGAYHFSNRAKVTCPECLKVAEKTEQLFTRK
jgi:rubrerythrin